ncbi:hypothetical protein PDE_05720 [Penicillium oxalicum 114-2]|uniref:Uncharacterized protein n=1 Tax=Penicillium oxalicum (strain 114-2 / CGMCC 5302) TaxID=933388 RepID=S8AWT7_PENO1|nr:hypothetical protein PDE_05720 [Penicillium oxalicum 114-2]
MRASSVCAGHGLSRDGSSKKTILVHPLHDSSPQTFYDPCPWNLPRLLPKGTGGVFLWGAAVKIPASNRGFGKTQLPLPDQLFRTPETPSLIGTVSWAVPLQLTTDAGTRMLIASQAESLSTAKTPESVLCHPTLTHIEDQHRRAVPSEMPTPELIGPPESWTVGFPGNNGTSIPSLMKHKGDVLRRSVCSHAART